MKKIGFNDNWLFYKEGSAAGTPVTLPHDAMIHEKRLPDAPGGSGHGYFPGGIYTYEKTFTAPAEWAGKEVWLRFEGIYKNSTVSINGKKAGERPYGYVPFEVKADGLLNMGGENTVTVKVDNSKLPNSRWYSGSGIYRPVSVIVGNPNHIDWQGVHITTLSYKPARIKVETAVTGSGEIAVTILDPDGKKVASGLGASLELEIPQAKLWSDETPSLYTCHVTLTADGVLSDEVTESFGIRKIEWSPKGLFVNGKNTLLRGGCFHHDNGILGAAAYEESEERRVRILKENGFNALRSSHNPTSDAFVAACDKYGVYLMDETFDMWYMHKTKYDYADDFEAWWEADTRAMVERDYNHPSVILYSIGNEVSEPAQEKGIAQTRAFVDLIHKLDPSRPVTGGINLMIIYTSSKGKGIYQDGDPMEKTNQKKSGGKTGGQENGKPESKNSSLLFNTIASFMGSGMNKSANSDKADQVTSPCLDALDIAGYNYASGRYAMEGAKHPDRILFGSETFPQDIYKNWEMVKKYPYLIGDFMWTAWDYLGEAGIGCWSYTGGMPFNRPYPWILGGAGVIDILGTPDASCRYASVVWELTDKPVIGVQPVNHPGVRPSKSVWRGTNAIESWAWKDCTGNKAVIEVYARAASVELVLNGVSLGKKKLKECKATFKAKYEPGILTAVAYDASGKEISRSELKSATGKLKLSAVPETDTIPVGGIAYIPVSIQGENGVVESAADRKLTAAVTGGTLLAFGSANPCTEENYDVGSFTTYQGRALAIVRADAPGTIRLTVSDGTLQAEASVTAKA